MKGDGEDVSPRSRLGFGETFAVGGGSHYRRRQMASQPKWSPLRNKMRSGIAALAREALTTKRTVDALYATSFFANLSEAQMAMLAASGRRRTLSRYTVLYREDGAAHAFYVLLRGTLRTTSGWGPHGSDRAGSSGMGQTKPLLSVDGNSGNAVPFGLEPLTGVARHASCTVVSEEAYVVAFPTASLSIGRDSVSLAQSVIDNYVAAELHAMDLFGNVPASAIRQVVGLFVLEEVPAEQPVFDQGDPGDKFYILLHGKLRVFMGDIHLAVLEAADSGPQDDDSRHGLNGTQNGYPFFGEAALLENSKRGASVHTITTAKLLYLSRQHFGKFLSLVPDFRKRMTRTKEVRKKQSELNLLMAQEREDRKAVSRFDAGLSPEGRRMLRQATVAKEAWEEEEDLIRDHGATAVAEREKRHAQMTRRSRLSRDRSSEREEAAIQIQTQVRSRQGMKRLENSR